MANRGPTHPIHPLKKYKHWVNEGGISTPLIVHWPKTIPKTSLGKFTDQYGFLPDIMATIVDVAKAKYPANYKGNIITPLQGKSLLPVIEGKDVAVHQEPIFWEHEGNAAVRSGNFKLVSEYQTGKSTKWELYDLNKDRSELKDLSAAMPAKVEELTRAYQNWANLAGVVPYGEIVKIQAKKKKVAKVTPQ
jgi:arylsulfatase A-like enzyme